MNGLLVKIAAPLAAIGILGAFGVYAKQGRIDVRVTHVEGRMKALEERHEASMKEIRDLFRDIDRRLPRGEAARR
jgi:hypothetical protein